MSWYISQRNSTKEEKERDWQTLTLLSNFACNRPKYVDTGGYGGNCKWVKVCGLLHMDFEKVLPDSSGTNK